MAETAKLTNSMEIPSLPFVIRMDKERTAAYIQKQEKKKKQKEGEKPFSITLDELIQAIEKTGLMNIDRDNIEERFPDILEGNSVCIARAIPVVHGQDGYIQFNFEENVAEKMWQEDESEKVDFRERNEINNVRKGDLLGEVMPVTEGKDGVDVLGQPIKAKEGKPARMKAGHNVYVDEETLKGYAEIDGSVKQVRGVISVDPVRMVDGDVDFASGNIEFYGDVIVTGNVRETFRVKAGGNITVGGIVERATLEADGDIFVEKSIYGKEEVYVKAAGNISLGFAENANIEAGGSIYVKRALVNCQTFARRKVFLKAEGKALIGGKVTADCGMVANSLGNPRTPVKTIVEFGFRNAIARRVERIKAELGQLEEHEQERRREILQELEQINEDIRGMYHAKVVTRGITYPGVILKSGEVAFEVMNEINALTFYRFRGSKKMSMHATDTD